MSRARFVCRRGKTYLAPTSSETHPAIKHRHLFIVLTDPSKTGEVVTVGISTIRDSTPDGALTCRLNAGDHPFIRHPSYVDYHRARVESAALVESKFAHGIIRPLDDLGDDALRKVCAGLLKSNNVRLRVQEFYEDNAQ